jgi:4-hydroxy 2-oxovalerate aldolase
MYRPEVRLLDCTIRDGGLMNNWNFDKAMVKDVFDGLAKAGLDYVELGYRADKKLFSPDEYGPWRFCDEEDLREVAYPCDSKVSIMCDVGRTDYDTILPADESIVHLIRVATYVNDVEEALRLSRHCKEQGYEVSVNIMAVSHATEAELDACLEKLAKTDIDMVYFVDSFGFFNIDQVKYYCEKYVSRLPGKHFGVHTHNNQQLAFGNTIEALQKGASLADGTIYGIGRAAGNCPLELIMSYLQNPRFDVRPVLDLVQRYFESLKQELRWGYEVPYAITGLLNQHPRTAMALMKETDEKPYSAFYDELKQGDGA